MNSPGPRALLSLFLLATLLLEAPRVQGQLSIQGVSVRGDGSFEIQFPGDPASYYRLLSGASIDSINAPVALGLNPPLISPPNNLPMRFFVVQQILRSSSLDTDGDQIPDIYELLHPPLSGLNALDAATDPDGNGRTA